jgi:hypothetical protein
MTTPNPANVPADAAKVTADETKVAADTAWAAGFDAEAKTDEATLATDTAQETADAEAAPVVVPPVTPPPPPPPATTGKLIIGAFGGIGIPAATSLLTAAGLTPAKSAAMDFSYASGTAFASNDGQITALDTFVGPYKVFAEAMYWNGGGYDPDALLPFSTPGDTNNAKAIAYYTDSAKKCLAAGVTIIRLGWEFNGAFAGAAKAGPTVANFQRTWQFIYGIYNGVATAAGKPSGYFSFQFCPDSTEGNGSFGSAPSGFTVSDYYPGKAFMGNPGYIATDYYPSASWPAFSRWLAAGTATNGGWGFQTMLDLAKANGHGLALGEWGSQNVDEPQAMTDMLAWMVGTALPALGGAPVILMMWGDNWNGTSSPTSSWDLSGEPNQWAAVKAAIATYKASGVIAG